MPQREFSTTVDIDAPCSRAWQVLVGFDDYRAWCPTHREINGHPRVGEALRIRLAREPGSDATVAVRATVRGVEPEHELAYGGGVPHAPWLFDVHHVFRLERLDDGRCRLHHFERFRGALMLILGPWIASRVGSGYAAFNADFRRRCESPPE